MHVDNACCGVDKIAVYVHNSSKQIVRWQDYAGIGKGIVSDYMKSKKKEISK